MTDAANAPRWAGGIGPRDAGAHTPDITLIVALGHTAEETAARLTSIARYIENPGRNEHEADNPANLKGHQPGHPGRVRRRLPGGSRTATGKCSR